LSLIDFAVHSVHSEQTLV